MYFSLSKWIILYERVFHVNLILIYALKCLSINVLYVYISDRIAFIKFLYFNTVNQSFISNSYFKEKEIFDQDAFESF